MSTAHIEVPPALKRGGRRFGYGVAVAINVVMLVAVQHILDWGWLPFLTDQFARLVPWISFGLLVTIAANLVYTFDDGARVKSTGQIVVNLISISVTYQVLRIFPFDFSGTTFAWEVVVRVVLVLAMLGAGFGVLAEVIKLVSSEVQRKGT